MSAEVKGFDVEFIQTDPEGSPTPGSGHHAGFRFFATLHEARGYALPASKFLGKPVPSECWAPCCDWQSPETPVTSVVIVSYPDGEHFEEYTE